MTVGNTIQEMIENSMRSAYIVSPRFDDYKIEGVTINDSGLQTLMEMELKKLVEEYAEQKLKKPEKQYDSHVKTYGKFKREEDKDTLSELTSQMQQIKSLTSNPQAFFMSNLTKLLPMLAPLLIAAQMPQIIEGVIELLTRPGMPLDPRFTRFMEKEWNTGLDRQTQFNTMIGKRNVVVQTSAGWRNNLGAGHTSVYKRIAEGTGIGPRLGTLVGMPDKSIGAGGR